MWEEPLPNFKWESDLVNVCYDWRLYNMNEDIIINLVRMAVSMIPEAIDLGSSDYNGNI